MTVRVTLKTAPLEQWAVAREMRQRIKARFDHEGIEIPLPQRMVWHRDMPSPGCRAGAPESATDPEYAGPASPARDRADVRVLRPARRRA